MVASALITLIAACSAPSSAPRLFPVSQDGKWGYIDKTGEIVIEPQYDWAWGFSEGLAAVRIGDMSGYIDETGKIIIEPQYDSAWGFSEGLAAVRIGDMSGYIDKTGKIVIEPQYKTAGTFSESLPQ